MKNKKTSFMVLPISVFLSFYLLLPLCFFLVSCGKKASPTEETKHNSQIVGKVLDFYDNYAPIPNAELQILEDKRKTLTNEMGEYYLKNLAASSYTLVCSMSNYTPQTKVVKLSTEETKIVDFFLFSTQKGTLQIIVKDKATLAGLAASIQCGATAYETDSTGYVKIANLSRGEITVTAKAKFYSQESATVQIIPRKTTNLEFLLMCTSGSIKGRVVRESTNNIAIPSAWITIDETKYFSDENGNIFIKQVEAGKITLTVSAYNNFGEEIKKTLADISIQTGATTDLSTIILAASQDTLEPNNEFNQAVDLSPTFSKTAFIWDASDSDYYFFQLSQTSQKTLYLDVTGSKDIQYFCDIYDASFTKIGSTYAGSSGNTQIGQFFAIFPADEKFYIKIRSGFGKWNKFDQYNLQLK
jgi:hypothetical protein